MAFCESSNGSFSDILYDSSGFPRERFPMPIGHFTVMDGSEADANLVLIQTFLLTSIFQGQFP